MSKKTLNTTGIQNELEGASLHFRQQRAVKAKSPKTAKRAGRSPKPARKRTQDGGTVSPSRSVSRAVDLPSNAEPKQLTGRAVSRPVSFYLPMVIDAKIDEAVDYLATQRGVKVDRTAVVSAILGDPSLWEPEALDRLIDRAINQLTSRLAGRLTDGSIDRPTDRPTGRMDEHDDSERKQESQPENPPTEVEMRSVP